MADEFLTLLDIAATNAGEGLKKLIEKDIPIAPEVGKFPVMMIDGVSFDTVIREALPTTDYVIAGNGIATSKSRYAKKTVECKFRDGQMRVYEAHALAHKGGKEELLAMEMDGMVKAAIKTIGKTIIYGNGANGSAQGFPGAIQTVDTNMVVDAGGTTASTGSSVYAFKIGEEFAKLIFGNNRVLEPAQVEWLLQQVTGEDSKPTSAFVNNLSGWEGVSWANPWCVGRIKKITADAGKTMTDNLGYDLLEKFHKNLGELPDFFLASPRSAGQVRKSRTATNPSGSPAPWPLDIAGIPLLVTNSILETEALTL